MANCHELFQHFNSTIKLSETNTNLLMNVRSELRKRMDNGFLELQKVDLGNHTLEFQTQGSFVMDTIITPKDDDFDLDDGVYFIGDLNIDKRPSVDDFHKWVVYVIGQNEDYATIDDRDACVRVAFKKEKFHIDLPIYYKDQAEDPDLAHKKDDWSISNPVKFIVWFEEKIKSDFKVSYLLEEVKMFSEYEKWLNDIRNEDHQLRRIVRYLKGWGDDLRGEMPTGIILTILAAENYKPNDRDDIALRDTLKAIKSFLDNNGCKCPRPTTPENDDLFASYSQSKKDYFLSVLNSFITSATQAIDNPNQKDSCLKWQKHLGSRFSCAIAKDEITDSNT